MGIPDGLSDDPNMRVLQSTGFEQKTKTVAVERRHGAHRQGESLPHQLIYDWEKVLNQLRTGAPEVVQSIEYR